MRFMGFPTKRECRLAVQDEIRRLAYVDGIPQFGLEFSSGLLSGLIEHHHYYCRNRGLRPDKFRLDSPHDGMHYTFMAHFPGRGWKPTSWNKAIAETTFEDHCRQAIRGYVSELCRKRVEAYPVCELCGEKPSADAHHERPLFRHIADFVGTMISAEDREWMLENYFQNEEHATQFLLDQNHPAVQMAIDIHMSRAMRLVAVCKDCHKAETRRTAT